MKILVVAHPDDEILWFNPLKFDKIIIAFLNRFDKPWMGDARLRVINKHPLKKKIELVGLTESNYWRDKSKFSEYQNGYNKLIDYLLKLKDVELIYTHNPWGEYNHADHILVHNAVRKVVKNVPIYCFNGITPTIPYKTTLEAMDLEFFRKVRALYQSERVWTWSGDYLPEQRQSYFEV